jgi:hypothetical protein
MIEFVENYFKPYGVDFRMRLHVVFTSSIAIHFQASTSSGFITDFRHNNQSLHDQTHALSNHYQTGLINKMKSFESVLKPISSSNLLLPAPITLPFL